MPHFMNKAEEQTSATEAAGYIAGVAIGLARSVLRVITNRTIVGLVLVNFGVFVGTAAFLPTPPGGYGYSYNGPISHLFGYLTNSRIHWHIPWLVTLGTTLISIGALLLFSKRKRHAANHD